MLSIPAKQPGTEAHAKQAGPSQQIRTKHVRKLLAGCTNMTSRETGAVFGPDRGADKLVEGF